MLALDLISNSITPIKLSITVQSAIKVMDRFKVNHFPVVNNDFEYLGLIFNDELLKLPLNQNLSNSINFSTLNNFVYHNQHVYDVICVCYQQKLSLIPVLDENQKYLGSILLTTIIDSIAKLTSVINAGGVIVLEINQNDNSLAHISQIIEAQGAQILSSYTQYLAETSKIEITLKINKVDIDPIIAALLRYNYLIKATYNHLNNTNEINLRYQSLMNYLSF